MVKHLVFILLMLLSYDYATSADFVAIGGYASPDSAFYGRYKYVRFLAPGDSACVSDSDFFDNSARMGFRVSKWGRADILAFPADFNEVVVPRLLNDGYRLVKVMLRGAASPEGTTQFNRFLGQHRAATLLDYLGEELQQSVSEDMLCQANDIEDYQSLLIMMQRAGDTDYGRVSRMWLDSNGNQSAFKQQLRTIDGGRVWNRLLHDYFPQLRQARFILWFAPRQAVQPVPVEVPQVVFEPTPIVPQPIHEVLMPQRYERRHLIAARTNLFHDFLYVPQFGWAPGFNLQLEYYPLRGHFTYNIGFTFTNHRHWSDYKFFQIRDLQLEVRRYFKGGGRFIGPYLAAYAEGTVFGIGFSNTKGWEGAGGGAGVTAGLTWRLNRKGSLRMEASVSLGFFYARHDPYIYNHPYVGYDDGKYYYDYYGNAQNFKKRNHQFTWFGPTNAGLHITYDIIYRKKKPVGYYEQKGGLR